MTMNNTIIIIKEKKIKDHPVALAVAKVGEIKIDENMKCSIEVNSPRMQRKLATIIHNLLSEEITEDIVEQGVANKPQLYSLVRKPTQKGSVQYFQALARQITEAWHRYEREDQEGFVLYAVTEDEYRDIVTGQKQIMDNLFLIKEDK